MVVCSSLTIGAQTHADDGSGQTSVTRSVSLWDTEHGLPSNKINAITKTPDGYVWLATSEGLIRFDGMRFSVFEHHSAPALPGSVIDDLVVDGHGTLWILAQGRVVRRDGDQFSDAGAALAGASVNRMWRGEDQEIYLATDAAVYHGGGGKLARIGSVPLPEVCYSFADLPGNRVLAGGSQGRLYSISDQGVHTVGSAAFFGNGSVSVVSDHKGGEWVACANGVYHGYKDNFIPRRASAPLSDLAWMWTTKDSTPNLLCEADGTIWVQNGSRLFHSHYGTLDPCTAQDGAPAHCARMGLDAGGRLWAVETTAAGNAVLYAWNGERFEKIPVNGAVYGSVRVPAYTDESGDYWIGGQSGLIWSREQICRTFGKADGLPESELTTAAAGHDGIWVGSQGSGLYRLAHGRFVRNAGMPADANITSLAAFAPGDLWVGREGIEVAALNHGALEDFPSRYPAPHLSNIMRYLARDSHGTLWASDGVLLFRCDDHHVTRVEIKSAEFLMGEITGVFVDSHDNVWVGGFGGFIELHDGTMMSYAQNPKLTGCRVTSICEGSDGAVWFGFNGAGLARWKDGDVKILTVAANGIPSDYINGMARDKDGRFWIGGSRGIYCVDEVQLSAVTDGRAPTAPFTRIEKADGAAGGALQTRYGNCVTEDDEGMLWFVCEHGLVRVDPSQFARTPTPTLLESVYVNGKNYSFGHTIIAPPGSGDLNIEYTAIRFVSSQRLRFEYRLRGYNSRWIDIGAGRSAAYMNLPPGTYTFDVRSYDAHSTTPLSRASVTVILKPFYYQTTAFRAACVMAILVTIWFLFLLRTRMLMARTRKLEAIVEARTSDLKKAHETVAAAYEQLEDQKQELEMHNEMLQNTQAELEAQNDELQSAQSELERQNNELQRMRAELEREKAALAEANVHLNALAITDGLTGLTNHRGFQDQLEREWTRSMRYGDSLSLLLLDVDHFKQYNDTYGHPQGDTVLKTIARLLMENCRDTDTPARYGGEEFVVVVPQTDSVGVAELAERIREVIASAPWPDRPVTASIGVVTYTAGMLNGRDLIEFADQALYFSKTHGRNRVTAYAHIAETAAPVR